MSGIYMEGKKLTPRELKNLIAIKNGGLVECGYCDQPTIPQNNCSNCSAPLKIAGYYLGQLTKEDAAWMIPRSYNPIQSLGCLETVGGYLDLTGTADPGPF